jgi:hypothetical protein
VNECVAAASCAHVRRESLNEDVSQFTG